MKRTTFILSLCLAYGLVLATCVDYQSVLERSDGGSGDDGGTVDGGDGPMNECEEFIFKVLGWFDDFCQGRDDCCLCRCWNDGRREMDYDTNRCRCGEPVEHPKRDEEMFELARECLNDETACRKDFVDEIAFICEEF